LSWDFVLMEAGGLVVLFLCAAVSASRFVRIDAVGRVNAWLAKLAHCADPWSSRRSTLFSLMPISLALLLVSGTLARLIEHTMTLPR
jgi:hypothetical protein